MHNRLNIVELSNAYHDHYRKNSDFLAGLRREGFQSLPSDYSELLPNNLNRVSPQFTPKNNNTAFRLIKLLATLGKAQRSSSVKLMTQQESKMAQL